MYVSSLNNLWACASSQAPTDHAYSPESDAADVGRGGHDGMEAVVMGKEPDTDAIAERRQVPAKEIEILVAAGRKAWAEISKDIPSPMTEHKLSSHRLDLYGRTDVFSIDDSGNMVVVDWKSNRERSVVRPQLNGYAACAADQYGLDPGQRVRVYVVWLRLGVIDVATMGPPDIADFERDLGHKRRDIGKVYNPGDACTFCRRQMDCEARAIFIRTASYALTAAQARQPASPADLAALYHQAKALKKSIAQYDAMLKACLKEGPLPDGQGNTLELGSKTREDIVAREAWPVLVDHGFSEDDLAACMAVQSGACMDIVKAKAPGRGKGAAVMALKEALREAGAIRPKTWSEIKLTKGTQQ